MSPIMQFGFEECCKRAVECGVDGFIIPDLPFKDYMQEFRPISDRYGLRIIMLITPETEESRIRFIDNNTDGFTYTSTTTTGAQRSFDEAKQEYFRRINAMNLRNPRMIGFGISNKQTLSSAIANTSGAMVQNLSPSRTKPAHRQKP